MTQDIEQKIVFAVAPEGQGDDVPIVILGVPRGAWRYMRDGKTHTFDLTGVGLPIKLMMFGAANHQAAMDILDKCMAERGAAYENRMRDDFSIKPREDK